jgi:alginate O-acetyltransferase complex protein AlgI
MNLFSLTWAAVIAGTITAFWLLPASLRFNALALATLVFVAFIDPVSAILLCLVIFSVWFYTSRDDLVSDRQALFAIGLPIGVLFSFKILSAASGDSVVETTIIPLGLAFYALRALHFSVERYLGRIGPTDLLSIARYLLFMPTIPIGPIHRFPEFARDVRRHRWNNELFSRGLERMLYGAFKIAVLANFLVSRLLENYIEHTFPQNAFLAPYGEMVVIGMNLYFQFSGASDIAIGFASCLGFRVIENFNWPLTATSIPEFWRRWHISLTSLVRDYVYAGAAAKLRNSGFAALITMLTIGVWHELSLRYVLWGVYHGLGIMAWQRFERTIPASLSSHRAYPFVGWLVTIHFVFFGFYFVRTLE